MDTLYYWRNYILILTELYHGHMGSVETVGVHGASGLRMVRPGEGEYSPPRRVHEAHGLRWFALERVNSLHHVARFIYPAPELIIPPGSVD